MPVPIPTLVASMPGMEAMATAMMKIHVQETRGRDGRRIARNGQESGVKLIACQMTMDVMGYKQSDMIEGVEFGGAATWLDVAADADINLFI